MSRTAWDNRIVEYDPAVPLDQLLAHPANPKIHPTAQTDALKGILGEVGWLTGLIVNQRTGYLLDGHDRVKAAMQAGQQTAPVFYVDVPPEAEAYILSTFDPVGALAAQDSALLADLLGSVQTGDAAVQALLDGLKEDIGTALLEQAAPNEVVPEQWMVLITCEGEMQQADLLDRLVREGYQCRALTS